MKKRNKPSFFYSKVFFNFLIIGICVALVFCFVSGFISYKIMEKQTTNKMDSILREKIDLITNFIEEEEREFYQIYDEDLFLEFLESNQSSSKTSYSKDEIMNSFVIVENKSLGLVNSSGIIVLDNNNGLIGFNVSTYPETVKYLEVAGPELTYRILPHPLENTFYLLLNKKIYDKNGTYEGIFSYRLLDDKLEILLDKVGDFGDFAEGYLINQEYILITPSTHVFGEGAGRVIQAVNTSNSLECLNTLSGLGKENNEIIFGELNEYESYWGEKVIGQYVAMNKLNWCLFVEIEKDNFFKKYFEFLIVKEIFGFFMVVFLFVLFGYFKYENSKT